MYNYLLNSNATMCMYYLGRSTTLASIYTAAGGSTSLTSAPGTPGTASR